jgi:hypothetical protein
MYVLLKSVLAYVYQCASIYITWSKNVERTLIDFPAKFDVSHHDLGMRGGAPADLVPSAENRGSCTPGGVG